MKSRLIRSTCAAAFAMLPGAAWAQSGTGNSGTQPPIAPRPLAEQGSPSPSRDTVVINAPAGNVRGQTQQGLNIFKGLPYAAPPVGKLRWRPPVKVPAWNGVRDATRFGPACIQAGAPPEFFYYEDAGEESEDCLSLNIWAPENVRNAPVFFWIHGGALINGAGSRAMFDGSELAKRGLIVVTINYRLGVLGYLAHPELSAESDQGISGNYGLLDQIAALRWVRRNISAFGGNPDNVTIAGESAGGLSVLYLLASPLARGLYHKAIAQSAYMVNTPELRVRRFGISSAQDSGSWLQQQLHMAGLADLRAMDARALTLAALRAGWGPAGTIDGHVLPRQLVDIFDSGEQARVPVIAGFNSGEMRTLRLMMPPKPASLQAYEDAIRRDYKYMAPAYLSFYPPGDLEESMLAAQRDAAFGWTSQRLVIKQTALGERGYLYMFDHGAPETDKAGLHAFHASEVPYIFGTTHHTPPNWPKVAQTEAELGLSRAMSDYWASFARTGVPYAEGQPEWKAFGENHAFMRFSESPVPGTDLLPGHYELHEEAMCRRRAADIAWNRTIGVGATSMPDEKPGC